MKRVVVTGLGMVTPLACGVEATWRRLLAGESAAARVENFDVSDIACQIAAQVPRGAAPDAFNPDDWMEPKEQRRVDDFIVYAMAAATQALRDADWAPKTYEERDRNRRADRLGHRRPRRHLRRLGHAARERAAAHFAVLHPRPPDQSGERPRLDRPQAQGPQSCRRHRLLDRRARDRRRGAADRARRRQGDGRRRRRIGGQSPFARGLRGLPRAVDRVQRSAEAGLAPLRSRSRRLRDGRGRGLRRARGARTRQGARRAHLRRAHRLRPVRRRLSHHLADAGRRRRLSRDERGAEARRPVGLPTSITSTPTARRRRSATRSSCARSSACSAMPRRR